MANNACRSAGHSVQCSATTTTTATSTSTADSAAVLVVIMMRCVCACVRECACGAVCASAAADEAAAPIPRMRTFPHKSRIQCVRACISYDRLYGILKCMYVYGRKCARIPINNARRKGGTRTVASHFKDTAARRFRPGTDSTAPHTKATRTRHKHKHSTFTGHNNTDTTANISACICTKRARRTHTHTHEISAWYR